MSKTKIIVIVFVAVVIVAVCYWLYKKQDAIISAAEAEGNTPPVKIDAKEPVASSGGGLGGSVFGNIREAGLDVSTVTPKPVPVGFLDAPVSVTKSLPASGSSNQGTVITPVPVVELKDIGSVIPKLVAPVPALVDTGKLATLKPVSQSLLLGTAPVSSPSDRTNSAVDVAAVLPTYSSSLLGATRTIDSYTTIPTSVMITPRSY